MVVNIEHAESNPLVIKTGLLDFPGWESSVVIVLVKKWIEGELKSSHFDHIKRIMTERSEEENFSPTKTLDRALEKSSRGICLGNLRHSVLIIDTSHKEWKRTLIHEVMHHCNEYIDGILGGLSEGGSESCVIFQSSTLYYILEWIEKDK